MGLYFDKELRQAESVINRLIAAAQEHGGQVFLCQKNIPAFSVKLDSPVAI